MPLTRLARREWLGEETEGESMTIHHNYRLKLSEAERDFVDELAGIAFREAKVAGVPLDGSDHAERAVEALSTWIVASRPKPKPEPLPAPEPDPVIEPDDPDLEAHLALKGAGLL